MAGGGDAVFGINANAANTVYRRAGNDWAQVVGGDNPSGALTSMTAVGSDAWGIDANDSNKIYRVGATFTLVGGALTSIAGGLGIGGGNLWGINANSDVFRWNGHGWEGVGGKLTSISVAKSNITWGDGGNAVWGLH